MLRRFMGGAAAIVLLTTAAAFVGTSASSAGTVPSGQRTVGNTSFVAPVSPDPNATFVGGGATVEPAVNDANGSSVYLLTPTKAKVSPHAPTAPLYLPVYPVGSGIDPTTLNCAHVLADLTTVADNCPDHGPGVALAPPIANNPLYSHGVLGHDHLVGVASTGGDFNFVWEPTLIVFDTMPTHRLMTLDDINAAKLAHQITVIPLPSLDFNCSIVGASVYDHAAPAPTVG